MLIRNDVLLYAGPSSRALRILWIDPGRTLAWTLALGVPGGWPTRTPLARLEADVQNRHARLLLLDPYAARAPATAPTLAQLAARTRADTVIAALTSNGAMLFEADARRHLLSATALATGLSVTTVQRFLRRYWEGGQSADALWPDQTTVPPRRRSVHAGPAVRSTFRLAVARYAATHATFSRRAAYRQMLEDFYPERTLDALPTFGQFNYWIDKDAARQLV